MGLISRVSSRTYRDKNRKKVQKMNLAPQKSELNTAKKTGQKLKNYLKKPSSQRNAIYDQFYSDIDRQIFSIPANNDNNNVKPRRLSPAFLNQERMKLYKTREKLRKNSKVTYEIGSRIDAVLLFGRPFCQNNENNSTNDKLGIFSGTVIAIDDVNSCFKIKFDSASIEDRTVSDVDVRMIRKRVCTPKNEVKEMKVIVDDLIDECRPGDTRFRLTKEAEVLIQDLGRLLQLGQVSK